MALGNSHQQIGQKFWGILWYFPGWPKYTVFYALLLCLVALKLDLEIEIDFS
jgi:hypothetical protein